MKANELTHIQYKKATNLGSGHEGEITERYVIPTFVPQPNMKAIDVTDLTDEERAAVNEWYAEYTAYYQRAVSALFTFEDWLSHTYGESNNRPDVKWRTFRLDNVEILD